MSAVLTPGCEADLAELIRAAEVPFALRGGGTRARSYGAGQPLSAAGLKGISLYEPAALTLVAGAGERLGDITRLLAAEGQRLGFEPPDLRRFHGREGESTLGGIAALNHAGPRRLQTGACRDHMLGLRFVDGRGLVIRNGGRVMKNVTGYDLVKLLAGSKGRLGVISEIAFRLQPLPETEASLVLEGITAPEEVFALALASPFDLSAAAARGNEVLLRLEGFGPSVASRLTRLEALLDAARPGLVARRITDPARSAGLWQGLRDLEDFADMPFVLRLALRPSRLAVWRRALERAGISGLRMQTDLGGGLLWLGLGQGEPHAAPRLLQLCEDLARREGGAVSLAKGDWPDPGASPDRQSPAPQSPDPQNPAARLAAGLYRRFDPRGLFQSAEGL